MKKKLTKKQKKAKEKLEIEKYKSAQITTLFDEEVKNEFSDTNDFEFNESKDTDQKRLLSFPVIPSISLRNVEETMYDLQLALENKDFDSQSEISDFMNDYVNKSNSNKTKKGDIDSPPDVIAQKIMYEAFKTSSRKKRISLAKKALTIYDKCCDAYNVLAEESITNGEALMNYEKGVDAGEDFLLDYEPQAPEGEYWMDIKLRPYLRSLEGLANILWDIEEFEESLEVSSYLLEINKTDNQGIRYNHAYRLIAVDNFKEAKKLFKIYENDDTLESLFARFLLNLKENGITKKTRDDFNKAVMSNPYLLDYLTNAYILPKKIPENFTLGSKEEAVVTISNFERNVFDEVFFTKIVLCAYMMIRDLALANEKPGTTEKNIEMLNEIIKNMEDLVNNPDKLEEIKSDYEKEFGK